MPSGDIEHRRQGGAGPSPDDLPTAAPSAPEIAVPRIQTSVDEAPPEVPGYEILGAGRGVAGGMGRVWRARRLSDGAIAAVKIPGPGGRDDLFQREVEHLRALDHPHLVKYLDHGLARTADGPRPYLAMEYIYDARAITRHAWEKRLGVRARLEMFLQVCSAVGYLHGGGKGRTGRLIHRDLKPDNILASSKVDRDEQGHPRPDRVRLIDLGIATPVDPEAALAARAGEHGGVGTLSYMAPEQFDRRGEALDCATDVYALGVVLYELITGALPYPPERRDAYALKAAIENHDIERPARRARAMLKAPPAGVAPCACEGELEAIVLRALARHPEHRFRTVDGGSAEEDLSANLRALLDSRPLPMKSGRWYRASKTARRWARKPVGWMVVVASAVLIGLSTPSWIFAMAGGTQAAWERWAGQASTGWFAAAPVLVMTYGDETDYESLAKLVGRTEAGDADSMRAVMGALLEDFARGRPAVVAIDKFYSTPTPSDGAMLKGIEALRAIGRAVIVVGDPWFGLTPDAAAARVSFADRVVWGMALMADRQDRPWVLFAAQEAPEGIRPSLAALACALYERAAQDLAWSLDAANDRLTAHPAVAGEKAGAGAAPNDGKVIQLSGVMEAGVTSPNFDQAPDTLTGYYEICIPEPAHIAARSIDVSEYFRLPEAQRMRLIERRAIVIGDTRLAGADTHAYHDGRQIPGVMAHAAGIAQMLTARPITMPNDRRGEWARLALSGLLGLGAAWMTVSFVRASVRPGVGTDGARASRVTVPALVRWPAAAAAPVLAATAVVGLITGASLAWMVWGSVMYSPLVCAVTALAAFVLAIPVLVCRINHPWETSTPPKGD